MMLHLPTLLSKSNSYTPTHPGGISQTPISPADINTNEQQFSSNTPRKSTTPGQVYQEQLRYKRCEVRKTISQTAIDKKTVTIADDIYGATKNLSEMSNGGMSHSGFTSGNICTTQGHQNMLSAPEFHLKKLHSTNTDGSKSAERHGTRTSEPRCRSPQKMPKICVPRFVETNPDPRNFMHHRMQQQFGNSQSRGTTQGQVSQNGDKIGKREKRNGKNDKVYLRQTASESRLQKRVSYDMTVDTINGPCVQNGGSPKNLFNSRAQSETKIHRVDLSNQSNGYNLTNHLTGTKIINNGKSVRPVSYVPSDMIIDDQRSHKRQSHCLNVLNTFFKDREAKSNSEDNVLTGTNLSPCQRKLRQRAMKNDVNIINHQQANDKPLFQQKNIHIRCLPQEEEAHVNQNCDGKISNGSSQPLSQKSNMQFPRSQTDKRDIYTLQSNNCNERRQCDSQQQKQQYQRQQQQQSGQQPNHDSLYYQRQLQVQPQKNFQQKQQQQEQQRLAMLHYDERNRNQNLPLPQSHENTSSKDKIQAKPIHPNNQHQYKQKLSRTLNEPTGSQNNNCVSNRIVPQNIGQQLPGGGHTINGHPHIHVVSTGAEHIKDQHMFIPNRIQTKNLIQEIALDPQIISSTMPPVYSNQRSSIACVEEVAFLTQNHKGAYIKRPVKDDNRRFSYASEPPLVLQNQLSTNHRGIMNDATKHTVADIAEQRAAMISKLLQSNNNRQTYMKHATDQRMNNKRQPVPHRRPPPYRLPENQKQFNISQSTAHHKTADMSIQRNTEQKITAGKRSVSYHEITDLTALTGQSKINAVKTRPHVVKGQRRLSHLDLLNSGNFTAQTDRVMTLNNNNLSHQINRCSMPNMDSGYVSESAVSANKHNGPEFSIKHTIESHNTDRFPHDNKRLSASMPYENVAPKNGVSSNQQTLDKRQLNIDNKSSQFPALTALNFTDLPLVEHSNDIDPRHRPKMGTKTNIQLTMKSDNLISSLAKQNKTCSQNKCGFVNLVPPFRTNVTEQRHAMSPSPTTLTNEMTNPYSRPKIPVHPVNQKVLVSPKTGDDEDDMLSHKDVAQVESMFKSNSTTVNICKCLANLYIGKMLVIQRKVKNILACSKNRSSDASLSLNTTISAPLSHVVKKDCLILEKENCDRKTTDSTNNNEDNELIEEQRGIEQQPTETPSVKDTDSEILENVKDTSRHIDTEILVQDTNNNINEETVNPEASNPLEDNSHSKCFSSNDSSDELIANDTVGQQESLDVHANSDEVAANEPTQNDSVADHADRKKQRKDRHRNEKSSHASKHRHSTDSIDNAADEGSSSGRKEHNRSRKHRTRSRDRSVDALENNSDGGGVETSSTLDATKKSSRRRMKTKSRKSKHDSSDNKCQCDCLLNSTDGNMVSSDDANDTPRENTKHNSSKTDEGSKRHGKYKKSHDKQERGKSRTSTSVGNSNDNRDSDAKNQDSETPIVSNSADTKTNNVARTPIKETQCMNEPDISCTDYQNSELGSTIFQQESNSDNPTLEFEGEAGFLLSKTLQRPKNGRSTADDHSSQSQSNKQPVDSPQLTEVTNDVIGNPQLPTNITEQLSANEHLIDTHKIEQYTNDVVDNVEEEVMSDTTIDAAPAVTSTTVQLSEPQVNKIASMYRSISTEVQVCRCLVNMYFGHQPPNDTTAPPQDWKLVYTGVPVLLLNLGDSKCRDRRQLHMVLAEKGTGFALWRDVIDSLSKFKQVEESFHTMLNSMDHKKVIGFSYDNTNAANDFLAQVETLTADPMNVAISNLGTKPKKAHKTGGKFHKTAIKPLLSAESIDQPSSTDNSPRDSSDSGKSGRRLYRRHSFGSGANPYKLFKSLKKTQISSPCCFQHITSIRPKGTPGRKGKLGQKEEGISPRKHESGNAPSSGESNSGDSGIDKDNAQSNQSFGTIDYPKRTQSCLQII